jgi:hypothetical protein
LGWRFERFNLLAQRLDCLLLLGDQLLKPVDPLVLLLHERLDEIGDSAG